MSNTFDPYYTWLGIPPEEQPADHYRLLAIRCFEANTDVISNASDQRMGHLRTFQTGKRAAESQRLLNELSTATRCLLDPDQKKKYDAQLKARLDAKQAATAPKPVVATPVAKPLVAQAVPVTRPIMATVPAPPMPVQEVPQTISDASFVIEKRASHKRAGASPLLLGLVGMSALGVAGLVTFGAYYFLNRPSATPTPVVVHPTEVKPPAPLENKTPAPETTKKPVEPAVPPEETQPTTKPPGPKTNPANYFVGKVWSFEKSPEGFSGTIREISPRRWQESRSDGKTCLFEEKLRSENEVLIYDPKRQETFRLTSQEMLMNRANTTNWVSIMKGTWTASSPATKPPVNPIVDTNKTPPPAAGADNGPTGQKITLVFDGKSTAVLKTAEPLLTPEQACTVEFWLRNTGELENESAILRCGEFNFFKVAASDASRWALRLNILTENRTISTGGEPSTEISRDNAWHHFAFVNNGKELAIFFDGQSKLTRPLALFKLPIVPVVFGQIMKLPNQSPLGFQGEIRSIVVTKAAKYRFGQSFTPPASRGMVFPGNDVELALDAGVKQIDGHPDDRTTLVDSVDTPSPMPVKPTTPSTQTVERVPPPEKEKLEVAKGTVITVFGTKMKAALKPEQKLELGHELLKTSISETDTAVAYAILGEARTQALGSLHVDLLMEVIAEVDRRFVIDRTTITGKLLLEMNGTKLPPDQRELLAVDAMQTAEEAMQADKLPIAFELIDMATNSLKASKNLELKKSCRFLRDHILAVKTGSDDAHKALATLEQNADDPAANLIVGRFYALSLNDFPKGLPYLAKAVNAALGTAAQKEQAAKTPEERSAAAEAWYESASALKGHEKMAAQRHCFEQYEAVVEAITGILQVKAKERLAELKPLFEEADKAKLAVAKLSRSKKPLPGLILRLIAGNGNRAIPTPYISVVSNRLEISRLTSFRFTSKYATSSSAFQLIGLVIVDKDMDVIMNLSDCECLLDGKPFDARNQPIVNVKVPVKKGTYSILINAPFSPPNFQINRADTGESLLFHTTELLEAQMNLPATLANGLPSKGIRIEPEGN